MVTNGEKWLKNHLIKIRNDVSNSPTVCLTSEIPECVHANRPITTNDRLMQRSHLHYIIEFDIKGFFDNVNHAKLIRQIWASGIHDKHLIYVLRKILTALMKPENGETIIPSKGMPQGGIISPLLANIVPDEPDWWITSRRQDNPMVTSTFSGEAKLEHRIKTMVIAQ